MKTAQGKALQETFFELTSAVKIQLVEAVRFGHQAARDGFTVADAIRLYSSTRAIFTETEKQE